MAPLLASVPDVSKQSTKRRHNAALINHPDITYAYIIPVAETEQKLQYLSASEARRYLFINHFKMLYLLLINFQVSYLVNIQDSPEMLLKILALSESEDNL